MKTVNEVYIVSVGVDYEAQRVKKVFKEKPSDEEIEQIGKEEFNELLTKETISTDIELWYYNSLFIDVRRFLVE